MIRVPVSRVVTGVTGGVQIFPKEEKKKKERVKRERYIDPPCDARDDP